VWTKKSEPIEAPGKDNFS